MVIFNTIKPVIASSCKLVNFESKDMKERYQFILDPYALESAITKLDPTLHILAVKSNTNNKDNNIYSKSIKTRDITNIMEYLHKKKEIETFIDEGFNFVEFMIYTTDIEDKELKEYVERKITDNDTKETKPIIVNDNEDLAKNDIVSNIMINMPIYKVLVVRKFNYRKDKFTYNSIFRSNYEMIEYIDKHFKKE